MKYIVAFLCSLFSLYGICSADTSMQIEKLISLDAQQVEEVTRVLQRNVKDPDSLRLGGYQAGQSVSDTILICGYVNSKNSFGGYVGYTPFFMWFISKQPETSASLISEAPENPGEAFAAVNNLCEKAGMPIAKIDSLPKSGN